MVERHPWSRRAVITGLGVSAWAFALPTGAQAQAARTPRDKESAKGAKEKEKEDEKDKVRALRALVAPASLQGTGAATELWTLDGSVPGPVLRLRRNIEARHELTNDLPEPLSLHWHGLRVPVALDASGREPFAPAEAAEFVLRPPHAGTFWYHAAPPWPRPQARGVFGLVIVEEDRPVRVDREVAIVLDAWRLDASGGLAAADTKDPVDRLTLNGQQTLDIPVETNERLRLRILNACPFEALALRIERHQPLVMAIDGQPAEPFPARDGRVVLGPGNRADLFIDMELAPGSSVPLTVERQSGSANLGRLVYGQAAPSRTARPDRAEPLPSNGLPEKLDFRSAFRAELRLEPGAIMTAPQGGTGTGGARKDARGSGNADPSSAVRDPARKRPIFSVKRGRVVMAGLANPGPSAQAVHVHGHHMRLLDTLDDGWKPFWLDTVLVPARQTVRVAFLADNPGRWMITAQPLGNPAEPAVTWYEVS